MKKTYLLLSLLLIVNLCGCTDGADKVKMVEMTISPETVYHRPVLSSSWWDCLVYSESDNKEERVLSDIIMEGFDFLQDYERGYEYTFRAKKVWMSNPPMDVSSIKYVFAGRLEKRRVIVDDKEESIKLLVMPQKVEYFKRYPMEYENGLLVFSEALFCIDTKSDVSYDRYKNYVLREIEGFDFESGYEYILSVKKITQAKPYSVKFILEEIKDKQPADMPDWLKYR